MKLLHSIKGRILIYGGGCLAASLLINTAVSSYMSWTRQTEVAVSQLQRLAKQQAGATLLELKGALVPIETLAQTIAARKDENIELEIERSHVMDILHNVASSNSAFVSLYTCWHPEAFDGLDSMMAGEYGHDETGRFAPVWVATGKSKHTLHTVPPDLASRYDQIQTVTVTGPHPGYFEAQGQQVVSVIVPVTANGQVYGVIGADIDINQFNAIIRQSSPEDDSIHTALLTKEMFVSASNANNASGQRLDDSELEADLAIFGTDSSEQIDNHSEAIVVSSPVEWPIGDLGWKVAVSVPRDRILAAILPALYMQVALGAVCFILGLAVLGIVAARLARPIKLLTDKMHDISEGEGDLTQRVEIVSKDELGVLSSSFNTFVEKIHDIMVKVRSVTDRVTTASQEIANHTDQVSGSMNEQTQRVTQVAAAVEQMSASVTEVARKSADAAKNAQDSGQAAQEGGQVVDQTVQGMNAISEAVAAGAAAVTELGNRGQQIGQIIEVINDIADQTNLLALNAAIEAARAGEHGCGFAVVADEVRKLADRTTKATDEIASSIKAIQNETTEAVDRMNAGTAEVKEGVAHATEAGQSLERIVASAGEVATMIQSIAAAAEQQSAASGQIAKDIEAVSSSTQNATESTNQTASVAMQLSHQAGELQSLVGRFKVHQTS